MSRSTRSWVPAAVVAVAAAAVIGGFALFGPRDGSPGPGGGASATPTPSASGLSSAPAVAVYYVGDTPLGPRLYREFRSATGIVDPTADGIAAVVEASLDPDYRTAWPEGAFAAATYDGDVITVTLADTSLRRRPAGMTREEARIAVQQVVYTLQGAVQRRAPVQFRTVENPIDRVYGVPTAEPIVNDPPLDTLALVNVTSPEQGAQVSAGVLVVSGVASSFEATVPWEIRAGDGHVVLSGVSMAKGWLDRLYPWSGRADLSDLPPGDYTFIARTDDPSGGEGPAPTEDSKQFTVR
ncbi:MAG: Gmad2 immunoglobulin-like domain-containing protein [Nocardioides sp.]